MTTAGYIDGEDAALGDDAGDAAADVAGGCTPGGASAQFRGQVRPPSFMAPGSRAQVSATFDNCSGAPWLSLIHISEPTRPY